MDVWIVSESESLTAAIRKALLRLGIDCPSSRTINADSPTLFAASSEMRGHLVFFAASPFDPSHAPLLRRFRSLLDEGELIVVAPSPDSGMVLSAIRSGATDFLNADNELEREIEELMSRVSVMRGTKAPTGRLISIIPCHSPCDGSIIAVNMAAVVAKRSQKCALLDLHLRGGDISLLLKISPKYTIYDLLKYHASLDDAMLQQALTAHASGIRLLAGPPMFSDLRGIDASLIQRLLALAQASYPFVVVSCEDMVHAEQMQSVAASDEVVILMRLDLVAAHRAKQHYDFVTRNGVPAQRIHIVAMGTGVRGELSISSVKELLGVKVVHCIPDAPAAITASINVGNPVVLELPRSSASKAIVAFTESLTAFPSEATAFNKARALLRKTAAALALSPLTIAASTSLTAE
jgi:pilus assembly protein CpaE